ncbi:MAG: class I SAM-dependent methyltransferase [Myxococcota bacterium]
MGRLHLIEIEDQAWCPAVLRDAATAWLAWAIRSTRQDRFIAKHFAGVLKSVGADRVVDLCSGGSGPVLSVVEALREEGVPVQVRLTDKFPNLPAFQAAAKAGNGAVSFEREPVDATNVPPELAGMRTIFNAFHHFAPEQARAILADAAARRQPIAVYEVVAREPLALLGMMFVPINVALGVPFLRPFRWDWLALTWIVPAVPLLAIWDGVVSCLRVYSVDELRELVRDIPADGYTWEMGRYDLGMVPVKGTYLVGRPT